MPRFSQLGVLAKIQARWAVNDIQMRKLTAPFLGPERTRRQYPFRAFSETGAVLAGGSDWPVSEADPMLAVRVAVNRRDPDVDDDPFLPEQRLTVDEALAAHTSGSAWANKLDSSTGSIEVGKAADLVVLNRDPDEVPRAELGLINVDRTMVDGVTVYQR